MSEVNRPPPWDPASKDGAAKEVPASKKCTRCKNPLPLSFFQDIPHGRYGKRAECRVCMTMRRRIDRHFKRTGES